MCVFHIYIHIHVHMHIHIEYKPQRPRSVNKGARWDILLVTPLRRKQHRAPN